MYALPSWVRSGVWLYTDVGSGQQSKEGRGNCGSWGGECLALQPEALLA